jgi:hypothetical protein
VKLTLKRRSKLQIEVTASYPLDKDKKAMVHRVDTYLFVPKRLGINAESYPKYLFYRDLQTYSELLARPQSLVGILSPDNGLLAQLRQSIDNFRDNDTREEIHAFENQNRAFCHIVHNAVDSASQHILSNPDSADCESELAQLLQQQRQLLAIFRDLESTLHAACSRQQSRSIFLHSDEYLSLLVEESCCQLAGALQHQGMSVTELNQLALSELQYRKQRNYPSVPQPKRHNEALVYRRAGLKTYMESVFFLTNRNKPEGRLRQELMLSMAAGVAMIFATAAAFFAHVKYENWTTTFFLILVISYMFKDRIKALTQDYLRAKGQRLFFDFRTTIHGQTTGRALGIQRESFAFVPMAKLPPDIRQLRQHNQLDALDNDYCGEHAMLYKRHSSLYPARLAAAFSRSKADAIRQILHFDFTRFARKMENSKANVFVPDNGSYHKETARRVYHLHLVIKFQAGDTPVYQYYRIVMTRGGILRIEELANDLTEPGQAE